MPVICMQVCLVELEIFCFDPAGATRDTCKSKTDIRGSKSTLDSSISMKNRFSLGPSVEYFCFVRHTAKKTILTGSLSDEVSGSSRSPTEDDDESLYHKAKSKVECSMKIAIFGLLQMQTSH